MIMQRRSDYSRHLVADLLALADDGARDGVGDLTPGERAALFAAARDYATLDPESCTRCGQVLPYLQPDDPSEYMYDRGLRITVSGGYGMFIDPFERGDPEILLCHSCAHAVCAALPWFAAAIEAEYGHLDGPETTIWPTLEEAAVILDQPPESLVPFVDKVVTERGGIARLRPAMMIELARRRASRSALEVAGDMLDLAEGRSPEDIAAMRAEIEACFTTTDPSFEPEDATLFLAAVRRLSPPWADRLDALYRDALASPHGPIADEDPYRNGGFGPEEVTS